jgi:hypothetical protein
MNEEAEKYLIALLDAQLVEHPKLQFKYTYDQSTKTHIVEAVDTAEQLYVGTQSWDNFVYDTVAQFEAAFADESLLLTIADTLDYETGSLPIIYWLGPGKIQTQKPYPLVDSKKPHRITIREWDHTCGDGCCYTTGTDLIVDGEELTQYGRLDKETLDLLLAKLGIPAIVTHNWAY